MHACAGQMLYLPVGWFHEVTSFGGAGRTTHMAFNYWFHPPATADPAYPYASQFWARDWSTRGLDDDRGVVNELLYCLAHCAQSRVPRRHPSRRSSLSGRGNSGVC